MRLINLKNLRNHKAQKKREKALSFQNANRLLRGRQKVFNDFVSKIFPIEKQTQGKAHPLGLSKQLKCQTPKQILQRIPMALPHVKAGNTSENLLNEIRHMIYSLYQAKEITKKSM